MPVPVEAFYLSVEWRAPGNARRIEVAPEPLELETDEAGVLRLEAQIFRDQLPWLGLRLTGELASCVPRFLDSDGREQPMLALDDGAGARWWLQDGGWDATRCSHLSELHRTFGQFEVRIGEQRLLIDNQANDHSRAEIEHYLENFKGDLVWLVLGFGGATAASRTSLAGPALAAALSEFSAAAERVRARPATVLHEVQTLAPRARIRPKAATFRQHARTPAALMLPSRNGRETADIADNRFLRHMLHASQRLARTVVDASRQQALRLQRLAESEDVRSEHYRTVKTLRVQPEILDRQIADMGTRLVQLAEWSESEPEANTGRSGESRVRIIGPWKSHRDQFRYQKPMGRSASDETNKVKHHVIKLPMALARQVAAVLSFCQDFVFIGIGSFRYEPLRDGTSYCRIVAFDQVSSVTPSWDGWHTKMRQRSEYERQGWQRRPGPAERQELLRESRTSNLRSKTYRQAADAASTACAELNSSLASLRRQDQHWISLGVRVQPDMPMGMRYSLRPDYAALLKAHRRLQAVAGGVGVGPGALADLDRIGILHASAVYERWCLVTILGVLMDEFCFEPEQGWQDTLLRAVTGRPEPARLVLHRRDLALKAVLDIQTELPNGRRPDFRLHLSRDDPPQKHGEPAECLIVMDAKFRTRWRAGELAHVLDDLVEAKAYGQDRARVFILQPQPQMVTQASSPLRWGRHNDYGHAAPQDHKAGFIQLAAGNTRSNLVRLLALCVQEVFPEPVKVSESPQPERWSSASFCINCGTRHEDVDVEARATAGLRQAWTIACRKCRASTVRTHCYSCKRLLFKNSFVLTYHRTLADQITNVACPNCDAAFDPKLRTDLDSPWTDPREQQPPEACAAEQQTKS